MKKTITVIGPLYNEQGLVQRYVEEVVKVFRGALSLYRLELILVDDGSTDDTFSRMKEAQNLFPNIITTVKLTRNFGLEGAIFAGLKASTGSAVVVMDADLQDPPSVIVELVKKWNAGFHVVSAVRKSRPNDSAFKKITATLYYKLLAVLSGKVPFDKEAANFKLLSKTAVDRLLSLPEVNGVFRVLVPYIGLPAEKVYYERDKRFSGETKYSFRTMVPYALDSITSISVSPLRKIYVSVLLGFTVSLISLVLAIVTESDSNSYAIVSIISFLLTLVMISLTIIAEYLAQICIEVKKRPISMVQEVVKLKEGGE